MSKDVFVMMNHKSRFIAELESALISDERSGLDSISYEIHIETGDEIITVIFEGGYKKKILATGNSNGANAKEIIKAIYG